MTATHRGLMVSIATIACAIVVIYVSVNRESVTKMKAEQHRFALVISDIAPIAVSDDAALQVTCRRVLDAIAPTQSSRNTLSGYLHYCSLRAEVARRWPDLGLRDDGLAALLDATMCKATLGGVVVFKTRNGARFKEQHPVLARLRGEGEVHRDQTLLAFARAGYPKSAKVRLDEATELTLEDLWNDFVLNLVVLPREIAWTAQLLTLWLPRDGQWTDKFGVRHDMSQVALALSRYVPQTLGCADVHVLEALLLVVEVDRTVGWLSPLSRSESARVLEAGLCAIERSQSVEGGWRPDWWAGNRTADSVTLHDELIATGHILELLARYRLCASRLKGVRDRARARLTAVVATVLERSRADDIARRGCPISHALNALILTQQ